MRKFQFVRQTWFQILLAGIVLFVGAEQAMKVTANLNFLPTVLLLGAFTVPATFVAYFYQREQASDRGLHRNGVLVTATLTFLIGGVIGVIVAGFLEYETLIKLGPLLLLAVGLIEEACKLIFPLVLYWRGQYRSEADGLLFGVASGMGFAALETMGYGLVTLVRSAGNVGALEEVLLIRGFLSPAGHAAWTGFVCAVIWREREQKHRRLLNRNVIGAFILVAVLHTLWDTVSVFGGPTLIRTLIVLIGYMIIAAVSLTLLARRARESMRAEA
jgi:RsiW-degrading membrane proteinase PrsW (M82 family)